MYSYWLAFGIRNGNPASWLEVFVQIIGQQFSEVAARSRPFINAVRPIRIRHHLERKVVFNQFVDEAFGALIMHVIIPCAVDNEQITL